MAYAFNDDKSKIPVYSTDEVYSKDEVYNKDEVLAKDDIVIDNVKYTNVTGNKITIPRTLSDYNQRAQFNYVFPADGYLLIRNTIDSGANNLLENTLKLNGKIPIDLHFRYWSDNNGTERYQIPTQCIFVKKGMTFTGALHLNAQRLAKILTEFYPFTEIE